ncbi:MMACHC-like protein [Toxocara canis]|uniref:Cyanocobalamin reductase (cyanide-eliminating) n=1 Tax=Toxocara canis TaxID=6265 RepID=A0A0B2VLI7_TOXCA|nr:MMACHC-like protein [Toxocara canis]
MGGPETPMSVMNKLHELFPDREGFELHQFKIGSYNVVAGPCFELKYSDDAMGVVLLNTPSFFETTFKKWIQAKQKPEESVDELAKRFPSGPISAYFKEKFDQLKEVFDNSELVVTHDFDLLPNRRPKILMRACGQVAGATFFYHPPEEAIGTAGTALLAKKRSGVALHPKYGGYFAYRGVFVFPNVRLPSTFKEKRAAMLLDTVEKQEEAIALYNHHWWDGKYRDCGNPVEKYSDLQLKYFSTLPEQRWPIIAHWFQ